MFEVHKGLCGNLQTGWTQMDSGRYFGLIGWTQMDSGRYFGLIGWTQIDSGRFYGLIGGTIFRRIVK